MSELLVARQGPLAHVWLASNYDKKLSKQQFLNTNIVASSSLISARQIRPAAAQDPAHDTITLRLSGQLLLGIVRIYSRKTKYLLDDINDTLHKLKTSFQYASGASLGPAAVLAAAVNLPPQRTTLSSFSRITLQDQISGHDLFYQDDLVLDDAADQTAAASARLLQDSVASQLPDPDAPDRSVEIGRAGTDPDDAADLDLDLDLDFDLDADRSIEVGRDAQAALPDADQSVLDIGGKSPVQRGGLPDVTFDLDLPGDAPDAAPSTAPDAPQPPAPAVAVRTAKRRLVVDSQEDVERGIPNEVLRSIQALQATGRLPEDSLTLRLTPEEKLDLIHELAAPIQSKKRKIWNLDEQLRERCLELSAEEDALRADGPADESLDLDMDMDTNIDFDLSLPGLDSDHAPESPQKQPDNGDELVEDSGPENLRSTSQVAEHLRQFFFDKPAVTLDELMDKDTAPGVPTPLGTTHKSASAVRISNRREASKCFFELLVLATQDCVSLEQETPSAGTQIPDELRVRPRDLLVSKFL
ncbi:hypothetical protein METBIDRAFT_78085 [Metschnikowia bicuspidata var. bicuspidata NRRL YB-4993]|uniref:Rad21/Rec8-like protein N-terminal domain-containing protein n=1 Tax=Metschnikowia bicuspidata var. bicuspidata NRRL YB-4993 TaxID=869754 RepID=A0A1A0HAE1_9ASCO|nr:hypothetical protein METBIDRAFT_78085 [Metschnikowia bicuspidata var. bicuspidata NRRL YB-4993]OBA20981.1 hypothetical protein METBIDRAFT_78085 [Metschnikowia bicuspidata var. bicuspidata NRRL YB-4993]